MRKRPWTSVSPLRSLAIRNSRNQLTRDFRCRSIFDFFNTIKADKTVVASVRFAGGSVGLHDLIDAGFKLGDRESLLIKRKLGRDLTHRLLIVDSPPLYVHRDLSPLA